MDQIHQSFSYTTGNFCRFDVTEGPRHGRLERLRGNGRWVSTKRFYSRQLERNKIRYMQTKKGAPSGAKDFFYFRASVEDVIGGDDADDLTKTIHKFEVDFVTLQVRAIRNVPVQLSYVQETVITDTYLQYQTFPRESDEAEILYSIESLPRHGVLLLAVGDMGQQSRKLRAGSKFSQLDLLSGRLKYRIKSSSRDSRVDDAFTFFVRTASSASEQKSALQTFRINYVPGDSDVEITLELLEVDEGGKKAITERYLNIRGTGGGGVSRHFVYNVTRSPKHGTIDILAGNKLEVARHNSSYFTSEEIAAERVVYKHDNSESRRDTFHFLATGDSSGGYYRYPGSNFQYLAVFHIHVLLRNDHTPTRVVNKVFQVVERGQKLLTGDDFKFIDLDIDTKPEDIKYNNEGIPNGELVFVENPTVPITQFTQRDLDEERVLFRHLGASFGRIIIWVSDGNYYATEELEVRASPPFIRATAAESLPVQRGDSVFLSASNLSVETNLNARAKDIVFRIVEGPSIGQSLKDDLPTDTFTEQDLIDEKIEYRNNATESRRKSRRKKKKSQLTDDDLIRLSVTVPPGRETETKVDLRFRIFPESYWDPIRITSNNSLLVDESTSIAITQYDLQV